MNRKDTLRGQITGYKLDHLPTYGNSKIYFIAKISSEDKRKSIAFILKHHFPHAEILELAGLYRFMELAIHNKEQIQPITKLLKEMFNCNLIADSEC